MNAPQEPELSADLLRGADAIAAFLYGSPDERRKVYHLKAVKKCGLPVFYMGATLCARKSAIIKWIEAQEKEGLDRGFPSK